MDRAKAKEYGSEGIAEYQKFTPGSEKILAVIEDGHFMHGRVNEHRYHFDVNAPDGLFQSIHDNGVEQPGMIWWNEGRGHIISGTRRWLRLMASNLLRAEDNLPPRSMEFKINSRWTKAEAIQKYRRANQHQLGNDPLTRLEAAVLEFEQGVALDDVAGTWNLTERQIKNATLILNASPAVKQAIAMGELKLPAAFRLVCAHQTHEAQDAALAAPKADKPKRKYMPDDRRAELKAMLTEQLGGNVINPERLRELVALL